MVAQRTRGTQPLYTADESSLTMSAAKVLSMKDAGTTAAKLGAGACKVQRGTYVGNGAANPIAVAFRPQQVFISNTTPTAARMGWVIDGSDDNEHGMQGDGATTWSSAQIDLTATGFTPSGNANLNAVPYTWVAIGGAT